MVILRFTSSDGSLKSSVELKVEEFWNYFLRGKRRDRNKDCVLAAVFTDVKISFGSVAPSSHATRHPQP